MTVPIIDLTFHGVARRIDEACRDIGFFAVVGHGVRSDVLEGAWASATAFFDLPIEEKLVVRTDGPAYPYGYFPMHQESLGDEGAKDLNESFNLGPDTGGDIAGFASHARRWPVLDGFRSSWETYYNAMSDLASRLMGHMATGLQLDENFFDPLIDRHTGALRALNYPPQPGAPTMGRIRAAPHTDYGTLTILRPGATTGGLEVRSSQGEWVKIPPIENGFVVNIGDMMAMWTNDRWRSTLHRVVNPTSEHAATERRQSMAFFHQPNWDARIQCLPTCTDAQSPPRYPPTTAGAWLQEKVQAAHGTH